VTDPALVTLRRLFVDGYQELRARLTRRLGSADLANDALHDAWLRLARVERVGVVQNPSHYLLRVALNAADDQRRIEQRHLSSVDIENLADVPDDAPTPEQLVLARSAMDAFETILSELSARRRAIFLAARVGNIPRQVIADRLGVSRRLVARELRLAHKHFAARYKEFDDWRYSTSDLEES
jgi:RNA polymerase sigma-70 factor, ECF subfamily